MDHWCGGWQLSEPCAMIFAQLSAGLAGRPGTGPRPLDLASIALATGTVAVVLLLLMVASSYWNARQRRAANDPRGLLRQLCDVHGFHRRQQRLLLKASRLLAVQHPARFFLEPRLLAQAAELPSLASRRADLQQIAAELFGSTT